MTRLFFGILVAMAMLGDGVKLRHPAAARYIFMARYRHRTRTRRQRDSRRGHY